MRWLGLTAVLLCASLGVVAWVYLRDRDSASWRPPEAQLVRVDAQDALSALGGGACRTGCATALLDRVAARRWLVRVTRRGQPQCLRLDLDTFAIGPHGMSGVQPASCPRRGGALTRGRRAA